MALIRVKYIVVIPSSKQMYVEVPDNFDLENDGKKLAQKIVLEADEEIEVEHLEFATADEEQENEANFDLRDWCHRENS